jgi:hypothetical protein
MFKKILVAILAAQLVIQPVQAKSKCEQGFVGVDDLIVFAIGFWAVLITLDRWATRVQNEELKKKLEQEKAKPTTCSL